MPFQLQNTSQLHLLHWLLYWLLTQDGCQVHSLKSDVKKRKRELQEEQAQAIAQQLNPKLKCSIDIAHEKGSSSCLTALHVPLKEHGFLLNKSEFCDVICLRYRWSLSNLPQQCNCGTVFSVDHAMTCHLGGIPTIRHNEIRISLLLWSLRSVTMFLWNLYFNLFLVSTSLTGQPIMYQMLDWTFMHEISAALGKTHFSMSGYFTPMCRVTAPQPLLPCIENMRPLRRESMLNEFSRLNMVSSPH